MSRHDDPRRRHGGQQGYQGDHDRSRQGGGYAPQQGEYGHSFDPQFSQSGGLSPQEGGSDYPGHYAGNNDPRDYYQGGTFREQPSQGGSDYPGARGGYGPQGGSYGSPRQNYQGGGYQGGNYGGNYGGGYGQHRQGHQGVYQGGYQGDYPRHAGDPGWGSHAGQRGLGPQQGHNPGYGPGEEFDPDYHQWRSEQLQALDNDYRNWRQDRYKKFSDDFNSWRQQSQQGGSPTAQPGADTQRGTGSPTTDIATSAQTPGSKTK